MAERSNRPGKGAASSDEVPPDRFAVRISVRADTLIELLRTFPLDVGDRPHVERAADGGGTLYAFAPESQVDELKAAGYAVEVGENMSEMGRQRMAEVPKGDRFEGGRIPPRGLGVKSGRQSGKAGG